ncbi:MAG: ATP-binding protein, partial [Rhizobiaceae bacterium]
PKVQSPAPSSGEAEATRRARSLFDFSDIGATEAETPADDIDGRDAEAAGPDDAASEADTPCAEPARSDVSILEKLPVPVLIHSGDDLHYANGEFLALTGYSSLEALAAAGGIGALFADDYAETEETPDRQLRLRRPDGETFPVTAFLRSAPWHGGKALLLVLERSKETREPEAAPLKSPSVAELEARVAEMRTIIDTATDGVVLIAPDGVIRSISRPAEALFGFESDDIAGKPFETLFAMESQKSARDYLSGLSDHGVASVLNDGREVIGREAEGRFIPLFMTIGRLPGDSGYCAVVRDITQWKRAEEELTQARAVAERASSHKTEFLARVSHEIRTPLNAIIGFSELMIDEKFGPVANDRYRDYLRDINRSGNHVLDLVNDLLDISKIEAGQQDMSHEAVALNEALAEAVAIMQPQANRERVIIRSSFASNLPDVVADLRSIRQIALNILSNAIRYTQAGGQVIVSTAYETSGDIAVRVRDTGIGMTPAEIEQALKPFKQINALKRPRGDGTGLGLPLTKALVEANRARFEISSTPGKGTLVEIVFPATRVLAG